MRKMILCFVTICLLLLSGLPSLRAQERGQSNAGKKSFAQDEILVKFREGISKKEIDSFQKRRGLKKIKMLKRINVHHLRLPKGKSVDQTIRELKDNPFIEFVEPNYRVEFFNSPDAPENVKNFESRHGKIRKIKRTRGLKELIVSEAKEKSGPPSAVAGEAVRDAATFLGYDPSEITMADEKKSLTGHHVRFYQSYRGIPVYGSRITVHMDKNKRLHSIQSRTKDAAVKSTKPDIADQEAIQLAASSLNLSGTPEITGEPRLMIFPQGETSSLVWRVWLKSRNPLGAWEVVVDAADGRILLKRDRLARFDGIGNVFDPNPARTYANLCVTCNNPDCLTCTDASGSTLYRPTHGTDICPEQYPSDAIDLTPFVVSRAFSSLDGSGYLQGSNIRVINSNYGCGNQSCAQSPTGEFNYNYDDAQGRFEEVMAYYHLDEFRRRLNEDLGFNLLNNQVVIDAHSGISGAAMSPPNNIFMGDSHSLSGSNRCRELGEEADALIHEYGGHILFLQIQGEEFSQSGPGMEEGWADYIMASHFDDPVVGEWSDEISGTGYRRNLDNSLTMSDWLFGLFVEHYNGQIWGGTLWKVREKLMDQFVAGPTTRAEIADLMDIMVIEGLYFFSPPPFDYLNPPVVQGRDALLTALEVLQSMDPRYAQIDPQMIINEFGKRGIGPIPEIFPDDPYFDAQWPLHNTGTFAERDYYGNFVNDVTAQWDVDIDAPEAWALQTGRSNIVVAVSDSGVHYNHTDFGFEDMNFNGILDSGEDRNGNLLLDTGNIWVNGDDPAGDIPDNCDRVTYPSIALADDDCNGYVDDFIGWNFNGNNNNPTDGGIFGAHGTLVAGVIGALGDNNTGTAGINWDVSLMCLAMSPEAEVDAASESIMYAINNGADIINASWGIGPFGSYSQTLYEAVNVAASDNILFVNAAGNVEQVNFRDLDQNQLFPQKYILPNMIIVTALDGSGELSEVVGQYSVDLIAPTENYTALYEDEMQGTMYTRLPKTSGAAPHVTGAIALLLAEEDDRIDANPGYRELTMGEIRYLLLTSVDKWGSPTCVSGGMLNAFNLLQNYRDMDMDGYADIIEDLFDDDPAFPDKNDTAAHPDMDADDDGDGLPNNLELGYGSLPTVPPGDLARLLYPIHLENGQLKTGISAQDSDGDGVDDRCEVDEGNDPANPFDTPAPGACTTQCVDLDVDGYGNPGDASCPNGSQTDCDDGDPAVNPGVQEICNTIDDNCDGQIDEGVISLYYLDYDQDGYGHVNFTWPGAPTCVPPNPPLWVADNTDCDDGDASINPGAQETCNYLDENCNGLIDEDVINFYYLDYDQDGYGDVYYTWLGDPTCEPPNPPWWVADNTDCNDNDPTVNPGVPDSCGPCTDLDGDGYGNPGYAYCPNGSAPDCDENDDSVNPGAQEICNEIDDNCNGQIDEGVSNLYYLDYDQDGYGRVDLVWPYCEPPNSPLWVINNTDCNDGDPAVNPGVAEICNALDDNCDSRIDEAGGNGDVNGDGAVDIADALLVQRMAAGIIVPDGLQSCRSDVAPDGAPNGVIDIADVLVILRMATGLQ